MKAAVVREPGGPENLLIEERPVPQLQPGRVLVRIRAFGLNRSELMTRNGESGAAVKFPRVLGIECAGEIVETSSPALASGKTFLAAMGGMGRDFDGGYEEYALLPAAQVIPVRTTLSWAELGAIPETFGTAWGSLEKLRLERGQTLLVRGGTSSVGMAAITLAKDRGVRVIATTRQEAKRAALEANGADHVIIDDGTIAERVKTIVPGGADALLELIGSKTTLDSLAALRAGCARVPDRISRARLGYRARVCVCQAVGDRSSALRQRCDQSRRLRQHLPGDRRRRARRTLPSQHRSHVRTRRYRRCPSLHGSESCHRKSRRLDLRRV